MALDTSFLQPAVTAILDLDGSGERLLPLECKTPSNAEAVALLESAGSAQLFPGSRSPEGAMAGLWLYFSCFEQSHALAQELPTLEGSYWHAIVHRQEPDDWNSGYWFRRVGPIRYFPSCSMGPGRWAMSRPVRPGIRLPSLSFVRPQEIGPAAQPNEWLARSNV